MFKQILFSFDLKRIILWVVLLVLCFVMVALMNLILDVREDNRLDKAIRREERNKNNK